MLTERIRAIHIASEENYGSPNIHAELRDEGTRIGRKRVSHLMRQARIRGVSLRRSFVVTTRRDARQRPAPDLVNRCFAAEGPNQLWVADITYVPTWAGFIFLAIALDVCSRRIDRGNFQTKAEAGLAISIYIEGWCKPRRHHSALGRVSAATFERSTLKRANPSSAATSLQPQSPLEPKRKTVHGTGATPATQ